jgi:hypothetical protein
MGGSWIGARNVPLERDKTVGCCEKPLAMWRAGCSGAARSGCTATGQGACSVASSRSSPCFESNQDVLRVESASVSSRTMHEQQPGGRRESTLAFCNTCMAVAYGIFCTCESPCPLLRHVLWAVVGHSYAPTKGSSLTAAGASCLCHASDNEKAPARGEADFVGSSMSNCYLIR